MAFQWWQLAVVVAVGALAVWGLRVARRPALLTLAAALAMVSGFLLYTLVLDEPYVEHDLGDVAFVVLPAVLAAGLGSLAFRRTVAA